MTSAAELREMNDEQLEFALKEAQQDLFRLRFQASTEKLDAPSNLRKLRREIARIKTIAHERQLGAVSSEQPSA
ncbi:MAG: 50S ribosomal protein L29 [Maioricimonas sp. JB045]|uniref:Large ribosomal subunit protein uL29 n=1 Tax=Maioricimonas rarisocia TaxID=2528026 RepID=A0A517ZBN6_9PLAN|nr:50S ribosomal protein L29 [Maioricimonas rarisocia]QDU39850.1 50S ribosomal protein L29 [Maioricimonas rarisocia]